MDAGTSRWDFIGRAAVGALLGVIVGAVVGGLINVALVIVVMPLNRELRDAGGADPWMVYIFTAVVAGSSGAVSGALGAASKRPAVGLKTGMMIALLLASVYLVGLFRTHSDFSTIVTVVEFLCLWAGFLVGPAAAGALAGCIARDEAWG
jgi:hypothetical protein